MRRPYGRTLLAVGDNDVAAALTGARVWWVRTRAFMLSSLPPPSPESCWSVTPECTRRWGEATSSRRSPPSSSGGVVLGGGRGWVLSAAAGAFALESLFTLLNFMGVASTWRPTVQGAIIIVAVAAAAQVLATQAPRRLCGRAIRTTTNHCGTRAR